MSFIPFIGLKVWSFYGKWDHQIHRAGGCINYRDTFHQNHQYLIHLYKKMEIIISVMQRDRQSELYLGRENLKIGFVIMKVEMNRNCRIHDFYEVKGNPKYSNSREVLGRFTLEKGRYILIPTTFDPGNSINILFIPLYI